MARKTTLGRAAKGLPKYYLETGWWTENGFAGCPIEVVAAWPCCVSHCHQHASDGLLPADVETLALVLSLRLKDVRKAVTWLLQAGKLVLDGGNLVMVGYADEHPTGVEIQARAAERSKSGSAGNHKRWHVGPDGTPNPDECVLCEEMLNGSPEQSPDRSPPDRYSDRSPVADGSHGMGWDGMVNPSSSVVGGTTPRDPSPDDDETPDVTAVLEAIADRKQAQQAEVRNPTAWRRCVVANDRAELGGQIRAALERWPGAPATLIAGQVLGEDARNLSLYERPQEIPA